MNILKILFSFKGRITRKTYWAFSAPLLLVFLYICHLTEINILKIYEWETQWTLWRVGLVWLFAYLLLAIQVKRWHDRNKSAIWVLINFIPFIGVWSFIELGFLKGAPEINRFDPDHVPVVPVLSCIDCDFSIRQDEFKGKDLFCPNCGSRLDETPT